MFNYNSKYVQLMKSLIEEDQQERSIEQIQQKCFYESQLIS